VWMCEELQFGQRVAIDGVGSVLQIAVCDASALATSTESEPLVFSDNRQ
jgi:hypothetical protein